ncbi:MAG TPA: hypothetical protein VHR16_01570 [Candidatus Limnocylindrales bacterium]|nr:hypothetical protein [Candidatus Limnocylindrales bacterium]
MIGLLLSLYPAQWRRRYGEEFRAVLESRPLGPFDVADVVLGALDARSRALRLAGSPERNGGRFTMLRIGGIGAIAGGALWAIGFIGGNLDGGRLGLWFPIAALGSLAILLALVGLSAFQARRNPRLAWAAFVIPAAGTLISTIGMFGIATQSSELPMFFGLETWEVWVLGLLAMVIGSILFALATLQAAVISKGAAIALALTSGAFLVVASGLVGATSGQAWLTAAAVVAFGASWIWLGISALRRGPLRAVLPA